jgi:NitT/TauT family transport system substrate-binding protein
MALKKTRIEVNNAVFSLPYHVAKEEGYFADEGYDVELVPAGSGRDRDKEVPDQPIEDHRLVKSYGWHEGIEKGEFCMYRACEWGQIRRTQDSARNVKVISKRAAVATQAIVVRADSPYNVPHDLRGKTVAVNFHAGSHYITPCWAARCSARARCGPCTSAARSSACAFSRTARSKPPP